MSTRQRFNREMAQKQVLGEKALERAREENAQRRLEEENKVPKHMQDLLEHNELEKATVIFSQKAIELFCHLFSNSMESAVERGLKEFEKAVEEKVNKVVEQQLTRVFLSTSEAIHNFLSSAKESVVSTEDTEVIVKVVDLTTDATNTKTVRKTKTKKVRVGLGNSKEILRDTSPYLLEIYEQSPNVPIKLSDACKQVESKHGIVWRNPSHIITHLQSIGIPLHKEKFGFYMYTN